MMQARRVQTLPSRRIYPLGARSHDLAHVLASTPRMQGIYDTRRDNLKTVIREDFKNSQTKLAAALEIRANYVSRLLSGNQLSRKNIGDELARRIEHVSRRPRFWLDQQHDAAPAPDNTKNEGSHVMRRRVPLVTWDEAAKMLTSHDDAPAAPDRASIPSPVECGPRTVLLSVEGAAMLPRFREGDLIFADPEADPMHHNGFCLALLPGARAPVFRRLVQEAGRRYLHALNPAWPDPIVELTPDVQIVAAVICKIEPL